jgi:hypothetical protein
MTEKLNENVIKGPWPDKRKNNSLSAEQITKEVSKVAHAQEFVEGLTQETIVSAIHLLQKNGIDINDKNFIYEMGLIIEVMKGSIYRSIGFSYPTQIITELLKQMPAEKESLLSFKTIDKDQIKELLSYLETIEKENFWCGDDDDDEEEDPDLA